MKKILGYTLLLIIIVSVVICNYDSQLNTVEEKTISPLKIIHLALPEPSGLYFDSGDNTLWTVSDENSTIYQIDTLGKILNQIVVDGFDLEGITKFNDSVLVTILERDRVVVFLDTNGTEIKRFNIDLAGEPNKGLEGISFNNSTSTFYIINEKDPGLLLEIDKDGNELSRVNLNFTSDYSGLNYMNSKNELWIISDEEEVIMRCSADGKLLSKYKHNIEQIEGIAIDEVNSKIYIVSDPLENLYVFDLP